MKRDQTLTCRFSQTREQMKQFQKEVDQGIREEERHRRKVVTEAVQPKPKGTQGALSSIQMTIQSFLKGEQCIQGVSEMILVHFFTTVSLIIRALAGGSTKSVLEKESFNFMR
jgi:hypothetical protein